MAQNSVSQFFELLVAAAGQYNEAVVTELALLDAVYKDVKPEAVRQGQTMTVYFPDVGPWQDQQNNDWNPDPLNTAATSMVFNTRPGKGIMVTDWEQYRTEVDIIDKFLDPMYKRGAEFLNGQIAAICTSANFNYNAPVAGTVPNEVQYVDALSAWDALADAKVPMNDPSKLSLLVHNRVHKTMRNDPKWVQESIVSASIAREARETGRIANASMFRVLWDQQMPTTYSSMINGSVALINASTIVVGLNTKFTTDLVAGQALIFGNDATRIPYVISSISDDTHLTLAVVYAGTTTPNTSARRSFKLTGTVSCTNGAAAVTGSGTKFTTELAVGQSIIFYDADSTYTPYQVTAIASDTALTLGSNLAAPTISAKHANVQGFTSIMMHQYAIGVALRPLALPDSPVVKAMYMPIKGIPMRVMATFQHMVSGGGTFLSMDYAYALQVLRPSFGVVINS